MSGESSKEVRFSRGQRTINSVEEGKRKLCILKYVLRMQNAPKPIIKPVLLAQTVAGSPGPVGGFRSEVFFPNASRRYS
jgi:hypothetical protein